MINSTTKDDEYIKALLIRCGYSETYFDDLPTFKAWALAIKNAKDDNHSGH